MVALLRTNSQNPDFEHLVTQLDAGLKITDGKEHAFYDQFNNIDSIKYVVVAFVNNEAVGCGALKKVDETTAEVKRMFVLSEQRGKGIASEILREIERWASELGFRQIILETGVRQTEALQLYRKNGYQVIENYGQYKGVENSVCFGKSLR